MVSVFLHLLLSLNQNDGNKKAGSHQLIPAQDLEIRREGAPWLPSSGAMGLWVAGLASLPFCITELFDYLHAAVFNTMFSGGLLFMFTVLHICCNVVCFVSSIQSLLLFFAGGIEFKRLSSFFSGGVFSFCSFTLDACRAPTAQMGIMDGGGKKLG